MFKESKIEKLIEMVKRVAIEQKTDIGIEYSFNKKEEAFCVYQIEVYAQEKASEFKFEQYKAYQSLLENIKEEFVESCDIKINFAVDDGCEDYGYCDSESEILGQDDGKSVIKIEDVKLTEEDREVLDIYKLEVNNISFTIFIDGSKYGEVTFEGYDVDKFKSVKRIKGLREHINYMIDLCDGYDSVSKVKAEYGYSKNEYLDFLREDLNRIKTEGYFDKFLEGNKLLKENSVSLYYKSGFFGHSESAINIFHKGYFFNWNDYDYDNQEMQNLNFKTVHTFEDLSWMTSSVDEYFASLKDGNKLDGRGKRVVSKGKDIDFVDLFASYFSGNLLRSLFSDIEIEIFLNKGLIDDFITNDADGNIWILGLNGNKEKVFECKNLDIDCEDEDYNLEEIKESVNKLIKDINY